MLVGDTALVPLHTGHSCEVTITAKKSHLMASAIQRQRYPNLQRAGAPCVAAQRGCSPALVPCSCLQGTGGFVPIAIAEDFVPILLFAAFSASDAVTRWFN